MANIAGASKEFRAGRKELRKQRRIQRRQPSIEGHCRLKRRVGDLQRKTAQSKEELLERLFFHD
jgi:hypothetical protein